VLDEQLLAEDPQHEHRSDTYGAHDDESERKDGADKPKR
jgi:hypothetical protein